MRGQGSILSHLKALLPLLPQVIFDNFILFIYFFFQDLYPLRDTNSPLNAWQKNKQTKNGTATANKPTMYTFLFKVIM